jgi:flagellar basal body-associated protein FliL
MMIVAIAVLLVAMVSGVLVAMSATGGEDAEAAGEQQAAAEEAAPEKGWVEFGSAVANLNEVRMTRYLKVTIVLEVPVEDVPKVQEIMAGGQKAVYQDWITEYLSDLSLEEVRGAPQIQALRRDIQSGFRSIMKEYNPQVDPQEVDVLFTEYNVQ